MTRVGVVFVTVRRAPAPAPATSVRPASATLTTSFVCLIGFALLLLVQAHEIIKVSVGRVVVVFSTSMPFAHTNPISAREFTGLLR